MDKDLGKCMVFQIDEKRRLGTMRIDWYDGKLCNQWNPTNRIVELKTGSRIDLKKLQEY